MKGITCTDNFTFQVEHSNSTSSSEMCQACNTTIFIFAVFVVSLSLTHCVKCSVFYINICSFSTHPHFSQSMLVFLILNPYFLRLGLSAVGWTVTVFSITCGLYVVIDLFCMVEALLRAPWVALVRAMVRATRGLFAMSGGDGKGEEERDIRGERGVGDGVKR